MAKVRPHSGSSPGSSLLVRPRGTGALLVASHEGEEATATAVAFMRQAAGMVSPGATGLRWTDPYTCDVVVRPRLVGDGGTVHGPATLVTVRRRLGIWRVEGARTSTIRVAEPAPLQAVASPVRVSGQALAFEGAVCVKVTEDRASGHAVLGTGLVRGGGDTLREFGGEVAFDPPSGAFGCVLFYEVSEAVGEGTLKAAMVRVRFPALAGGGERARG